MSTVIFLGPTLPIAEAKKIYPDAWYCDPAKCMDVLKILRLKPRRILIIDGYYEQIAAVWHKEILLAMDEGVEVFGASSMGALRAAELAEFGMQGLGKIFQYFYSQKIIDDDEVAVLHAPEQGNFRALNDAMVNIRATVEKARNEKIISPALAEKIITVAKNLNYIDRKLIRISENLKMEFPQEVEKFLAWLTLGNYVNQKRLDAIAAIQYLHDQAEKSLKSKNKAEHSVFLRILSRKSNAEAFDKRYGFLPEIEKKLVELKQDNPEDYFATRRLAEFLNYCADFSHTVDAKIKLDHAELNKFIGFYKNDLDLAPIYQWLATVIEGVKNFPEQVLQHRKWLDKIYENSANSDYHEKILMQHAVIWTVFDIHNQNQQLYIAEEDFQATANKFLAGKSVFDEVALAAYLKTWDSEEDFNQFLLASAYLEIVYLRNNYDFQLQHLRARTFSWIAKAYEAASPS